MLRHQTAPEALPYRPTTAPASTSSVANPIPMAEKGRAFGVTPLDMDAKVSTARLRLSFDEGLTRVGDEVRLAIHTLPTG